MPSDEIGGELLQQPGPQGLYDPRYEHDACGVAFVADLNGRASNAIVRDGLDALINMQHRGATNAEPNTGDGAGLLIQIPDRFFRSLISDLPPVGHYASGMAFLPPTTELCQESKGVIETIMAEEGLRVLGWREVPVETESLGSQALGVMPSFEQIFVADAEGNASGLELDRKVFVARKRSEHELAPELGVGTYFPSLSSRTFVYKGMLTTPQLESFFPDLHDERIESAVALVHSRFSTNTFPSWPRAHPYRFVAHNGEINTVMGNRNWMRARESLLSADHWGERIEQLFPICTDGASDTASLDEALELLHLGGYPIHQAVLLMIPEAWEGNASIPDDQRAFYDFYSSGMEPWDGPASVTFTDGTTVGAVLDRNGLRPSRYWVTNDGRVIMASEVGVLNIDPANIVRKGRLEPGKMFLVDTEQGRIVDDDEIMSELAARNPYAEWLKQRVYLGDLPRPSTTGDPAVDRGQLVAEQSANGYTLEELDLLIDPMASEGKESIGSMGTDTPPAVLSNKPRLLFDYFSQLFAQVTNPPLDAIREELVTSHRVLIGPSANVLIPGPDWCKQLVLDHPAMTSATLDRIKAADQDPKLAHLNVAELTGLYPVHDGADGLRSVLDDVRRQASAAVRAGATVLVISNRGTTSDLAPVPSLLLTGAVHHHLTREKLRTQVGLIVEAADAKEVHHFALLLGCGANAICPSLVFETVADRLASGRLTGSTSSTEANYVKAASKGIIKIMSKMGISTVASYTGAQIFEALGLDQDLVDEYFTGVTSKLGGIGLAEIALECQLRHRRAFPDRSEALAHRELDAGGEYRWRREGEYHLFNPETVFKLQHATRAERFDVFKEYTDLVDSQAEHLATLRGLFKLRSDRPPIPLEDVEPASELFKRFATGAMSYGSISAEAHETLAIAMNRLGGKSNTGEGGEDPERFEAMPGGDSKRSAIKQVASGRFGVTAEYLTNSDDIQIKMAQGAKPGEGGQLPGPKVYPWIAKTRHSTPGVGLISPPPHHDIYSIEDLAQLIHDLKNANPTARIHVKLVAEVGVGTVAAGVSKAKSDVVLISGHDGGTGASPLTSLKHAGGPWELGLAETQQTLLLNDLRDRIVVQVDGQLKTGRDVIIAALLGAEEFGFATAPLVVSGCVMMRVCHLDTCPVGVATQNPELRAKFSGRPEFVETFFEYIAAEVRQYLADLGFRSLEEAIGHVECLDTEDAIEHWKASGIDLTPILYVPELDEGESRICRQEQDHGLDDALDNVLISEAREAIETGFPIAMSYSIANTNRTVGTMLGHEVTKRHGGDGLPTDTITINFTGSAGQSFGAFVPNGISLRLEGDANDYFGKGLSGGRLALRAPATAVFVPRENVIAGNVILYGATGGQAFIEGRVGERFCVRNSGAEAVVEGVGDHGCEYMTGGIAVVLGPTGRNFGAGMSGGVAYVFDPESRLPANLNGEMAQLEKLDAEDYESVNRLVRTHVLETQSSLGQELLDDWEVCRRQFVKVMPTDYRRILEAQERAERLGLDPTEAMMEAARG